MHGLFIEILLLLKPFLTLKDRIRPPNIFKIMYESVLCGPFFILVKFIAETVHEFFVNDK
tara:strand:- start:429 stop:608 length:180 start_codon:yes stop_codon:yes gene_type:complete